LQHRLRVVLGGTVTWAFDIRTALFLGAFLTLLIGLLLFAVRRQFAAALQPSLRWWIVATVVHPVGFLLIGLRELISDWWSTVLSNVLIGFAFAAFAISLRLFNGSPQRRARLYALVAATAVLAAWYSIADPDEAMRMGTISVLYALLLGSSARSIYRKGQERTATGHITGAMFLIGTAVMAWRGLAYLFLSYAIPIGSAFVASPLQIAAYAAGGLLPVVSTIGFLLMCTEFNQRELARAATLDYLTGICNRRAIEDLASRSIAAARRHGMPMALMIIDVDHFKRINDEFGHQAGDVALVETVKRIRDSLRSEDLVGRLGGEEFVAVMPNTDAASALAAAERMRAAFADAPMHLADRELLITVSIGVAVLDAQDQAYSQLLRRADRAMYGAKAAGRNKVMLDGSPLMTGGGVGESA
jgi:diguanylate cyclase (GGDEF)-like protein